MNKKLIEKLREAFGSVIPITAIMLILSFTVVPMPSQIIWLFVIGAAMLIVGMGFFTLGADTAMMPIGESLGKEITKSKRVWLIVIACFVIGFIITIAEPDLLVLAAQTPSVPDKTLIYTVAVGVGIFLVVAFLRILLKLNLAKLLIGFYIMVFGAAILFVPEEFHPVAFDSGGVTTGPITVPFIMALGLGLTSIRGDKDAESDSFGLVALCSIGPIITMLILGIIYKVDGGADSQLSLPEVVTFGDILMAFGKELPHYALEILLALTPIIVFFLIFQIFFFKMRKNQLSKILVGMLYTYIGLTLFLTGVNVGFMPAGYYMGTDLGGLSYNWVLLPLGALIGYVIVKAEPAVAVLNKQVEELSGGAISQKMMLTGLSVGMAISLTLAMIRILSGISIMWFLIPGYAIALALSYFVPKLFTAIAFDSGGVASGPMTATFLLPFAMGVCDAVGGSIMTDAFGIVAMVAMTPLITIQLLGIIYTIKTKRKIDEFEKVQDEEAIIDYEDDEQI